MREPTSLAIDSTATSCSLAHAGSAASRRRRLWDAHLTRDWRDTMHHTEDFIMEKTMSIAVDTTALYALSHTIVEQ